MAEIQSFASNLPVEEIKVMAGVFVVTLLMVKMVTKMKRKRYHLPPGPWGLPIVGYLPFFGAEPPITFTKLREKYGDVFSIRMGSFPAIVISGGETIKEALVTKRDEFSGRPDFTTSKLVIDGRPFRFLRHGLVWKKERKIISNVMYTFGNARKNPIEDIVRSEAKTVITEYLSHGQDSFCPLDYLLVATSSIMYQLCYGRLKDIRDDKDFMERIRHTREFLDFVGAGNPVDVMPWLRYIMRSKITRFVELIGENMRMRKKKVEEHESSFHEGELRDITDGLISAGNRLTEEEKAIGLSKDMVVGNLDVIFGAGFATVSTTLKWIVGLLAAFPEVQEEVFQQIDTVVGQGRDISFSDRPQLPLVEATVYEVLRFCGAVPLSIPHATTCDTTLQGYDIPAGTVVLVNLYSVFTDEKLWGDPKVFRPKRFLDSEGQLDRGLVEQSPVFSLGHRRCVGEFLARMELFLFTGTLIQRLKVCKPPGDSSFELKASFSLSVEVEPFNICVSPRA
ncbi:hypothetical protein ACOMHN_042047 [Nucella lapillus]